MSVCARACAGILKMTSTNICNLLSVDFLLLVPCTFLYQYIFRQKPVMTQYTEHIQKLLHVSTSRCHLQGVTHTLSQTADLLNNLLIYYKLASWFVHLCHSNSLKMAPGCRNFAYVMYIVSRRKLKLIGRLRLLALSGACWPVCLFRCR